MKTPLPILLFLTAGVALGSTTASTTGNLQKPERAGAQEPGQRGEAAGEAAREAKKGQVREVTRGKAKRVEGVTERGGPEAAGQEKQGAKDAQRVKEAREKAQAESDEARTKAARAKDAANKPASGVPAPGGFDKKAVALFGAEVRKHRVTHARLDRLATLFTEEGKDTGVARVAALRAKEDARYASVIARFETMLGAEQFATIRARLETRGSAGAGRGAGKGKPKKEGATPDRQGAKRSTDR